MKEKPQNIWEWIKAVLWFLAMGFLFYVFLFLCSIDQDMTALIEETAYWIGDNLIRIEKVWDKYLGTYYNTYINGELKPTKYSWLKRRTKPSKSELKKYIEKS